MLRPSTILHFVHVDSVASPFSSASHSTAPCTDYKDAGRSQTRQRRSKGKRTARQQTYFDRFPPGTPRWNDWMAEFQMIGLEEDAAFKALSNACRLLSFLPHGMAASFDSMMLLLMNRVGLSRQQVLKIVRSQPNSVKFNTLKANKALDLLVDIAGFRESELKVLVCGCPDILVFGASALNQRIQLFLVLGMDMPSLRNIWLQSPKLIASKCKTFTNNIATLQNAFGVSGRQLVNESPGAVKENINVLMMRRALLEHLAVEDVCLAMLWAGAGHERYVREKVSVIMRRSGKLQHQLCWELHALPGMTAIMHELHMDLATMTELDFYHAFSKWWSATHKPLSGFLRKGAAVKVVEHG